MHHIEVKIIGISMVGGVFNFNIIIAFLVHIFSLIQMHSYQVAVVAADRESVFSVQVHRRRIEDINLKLNACKAKIVHMIDAES